MGRRPAREDVLEDALAGSCYEGLGFDVDLVRFERERLNRTAPARPHGLPRPLVVSLTSYPPRFGSLHWTLASLLRQSLIADEILLWIAHDDMALLPEPVRALGDRVRIRPCADLRSYKKLVFAQAEEPDRFIAIADDDVYYKHDWLEELVEGLADGARNSSCHIGYRFHREGAGVASFLDWEIEPQDGRMRRPSTDILPIGVGGVLYPPHAFHPDLCRDELFRHLAPHSDDIWFYAMARLAGTLPAKVGGRFTQILWPDTQKVSLWSAVAPQRSDAAIAAVARHYGAALFDP